MAKRDEQPVASTTNDALPGTAHQLGGAPRSVVYTSFHGAKLSDIFADAAGQGARRKWDVLVGRTALDSEVVSTGTIAVGKSRHVQAAHQVSLQRDIALVSLKPGLVTAEARQRLVREGIIAGVLEHPNIVPVHMLGVDDEGGPLLAMQHLEGTRWQDLIVDADKAHMLSPSGDPLDLHVEVLIAVSNALAFAHSRSVVHRDVKPYNVLLGKFREVYVMAWGGAQVTDSPYFADSDVPPVVPGLVGTPGYMAPEQVSDPQSVDERTDVYLLGGCLYEVLAGCAPHHGATLSGVLSAAANGEFAPLPPDVPQTLARICERALSPNAADRYKTMAALRSDLTGFVADRAMEDLFSRGANALSMLRTSLELGNRQQYSRESYYSLFSECRFGFLQADRSTSQRGAARAGLRDAIELMVTYEIGRESEHAAAALLTELNDPEHPLWDDLRALRANQAEHRALRDELVEESTKWDPNIGARARGIVCLSVGIVSLLSNVTVGALWRSNSIELSAIPVAARTALSLIACIAAVVATRGRWSDTMVNRQYALTLSANFACQAALHMVVALAGAPVLMAVIAQPLIVSACCFAIGLVADARFMWAGLVALCTSFACSFVPTYAFEVQGVVGLACLFAIAWIWLDERGEVDRPTSARPVV